MSQIYEGVTYACGDESDKLWLLSNNINTSRGDTKSEVRWVIDNYGYKANCVAGEVSYNTLWLLRTPGTFYSITANPILDCITEVNFNDNLGVRPAFQITIP